MTEIKVTATNGRIDASEATLEIAEEDELIARAKQDPSVFGKLFDAYHDRIYKYILHRTANVYLAEEITSNTFFKALRKLGQFRGRGTPFTAWLYRIASNEVNKHFRKHKNYQSISVDVVAESREDASAASDGPMLEAEAREAKAQLFLEVHREIALLKMRYQEVIVLKYFEHKKITEIVRITGKSEGTIKSLLHRAHKQLRKNLHDINKYQIFS